MREAPRASLKKLLTLASPAACGTPAEYRGHQELTQLLEERNGFVAFESALMVLPSSTEAGLLDINQWNRAPWRKQYPEWDGAEIFGMDALMEQFAMLHGRVVRLDPATGSVREHSNSVDGWAGRILADYDRETGWSIAREWQNRHRVLRFGERLLPRLPFVLGGEYEEGNLTAVRAEVAAPHLGALAAQLRGLADGVSVKLRGWTPDSW